MNGVAVYFLVLAGVFLIPLSIAVVASRLRLGGAGIAVGVLALVIIGVGLATVGINSATHPSAAGLGRTVTAAPVPPRAKLLSQDIRDGDIEQQPQASISYVLPGLPLQECVAVVQTYLDAGHHISSSNILAGPAKPVRSAKTLCAQGFVQPDFNTPHAYLDLTVCKGEGTSEKCFSATLTQRTVEQKVLDGPGAPTGNSVLFLQALN